MNWSCHFWIDVQPLLSLKRGAGTNQIGINQPITRVTIDNTCLIYMLCIVILLAIGSRLQSKLIPTFTLICKYLIHSTLNLPFVLVPIYTFSTFHVPCGAGVQMGALRASVRHPCSHMLGSPFISLTLVTDSESPLISEVFRHSREFHFTSSLSAPSQIFHIPALGISKLA